MSARCPEILAPAGDHQSLDAALAAGADAVYFGLDEGFNARARATNFSTANLAETVARIHRAGARAYVTLNTLVFESELAHVEAVLRSVAVAGVDALIIQDPAVARLARSICPTLELHASTQMTISSGEAAGFAEGLGCTRVVVPRELSVQEIARFAAASPVELEVFIHGALCMSWSGQCLTSEAWGGRSANRGQCAQSCRMPYDLVVDDETRDLGDVRYLLSPKDLAGFRAVEALMEAGVASLKIEGRLKGPAYVQSAVEGYRRWATAVERGATDADQAALADDLGRMTLTYSRGFGDGFLAGSDHQTLVEGRFPKHRGALLGRVASVEDGAVVVRGAPDGRPRTGGLALGDGRTDAVGGVAAPLPALGGATDAATGAAATPVAPRAGMGVVFDAGQPESPDEPGGPIFAVEPLDGGGYRLGFGRPGPDLRRVSVGDRVWVTSDPALTRAAEKQAARAPEGRVAVRMMCDGQADTPLRIRAEAVGASVEVETDVPLAAARGAGLDAPLLRDKLGAFGGTPFRLDALDVAGLDAGLHVPVSALKRARRAVVDALLPAVDRGPRRETAAEPVLEALRASDAAKNPASAADAPRLVPLCRTREQLEAVIALGFDEVELDFMEFYGLGRAVERARGAGLRVTIATVRVQKPGEEGYDRRIARLAPDAVLIRHWGALMSFARGDARGPVVHGDFSLNVTNSLTFHHLRSLGLDTITVAHDLDRRQLAALLDHVPAAHVAVTVHHHIPTFHTEHCVYAHTLSNGRDYRTCGRPCEQHEVSLRDHTGRAHPVLVDVGCRNTVFNAEAQSAASLAPSLIERGVRRLRAEFVRESAEETTRVLAAWRALIAGEITPDDAIGRIGVHEQFGVTAGTMRILG